MKTLLPSKIPIGRLASSEGISTATLRYYEKLGLIQSQSRTSRGTRYFPAQARSILKAISRLQKMGFTLREVLDLQRLPSSHAAHQQRFRRVLAGKLQQHEARTQGCPAKKALPEQGAQALCAAGFGLWLRFRGAC